MDKKKDEGLFLVIFSVISSANSFLVIARILQDEASPLKLPFIYGNLDQFVPLYRKRSQNLCRLVYTLGNLPNKKKGA